MKIFLGLYLNDDHDGTGKYESRFIHTDKTFKLILPHSNGCKSMTETIYVTDAKKYGKFGYFTTTGLNEITDRLYDEMMANAINITEV